MPIFEYQGVAPRVHPSAFVHPTASIVGDVEIGARCYIGPSASIRGDFGKIAVADGEGEGGLGRSSQYPVPITSSTPAAAAAQVQCDTARFEVGSG